MGINIYLIGCVIKMIGKDLIYGMFLPGGGSAREGVHERSQVLGEREE
jgi:hypothetical protein